MDAFEANRIRRDSAHDAATLRAKDESADMLDSMRLAGFTFASDDRVTVADSIAKDAR